MAIEVNKNFPYLNPASSDDFTGIISQAFLYFIKQCDGVLPAKILAYDRQNNTAQVQIMINKVGTSGQIIPGKQLPNIPVVTMGGGDFCINFALKPGDTGYVVAMDRNISSFLKSLKAANPPVYTIKDFTSSVFIPSLIRGYSISGEDENSLVIQNLSGSVKISLSNDSINIEAPTVNIDSPNINIESASMVKMTTPMLHVEGSIEATGSITPHVPPL